MSEPRSWVEDGSVFVDGFDTHSDAARVCQDLNEVLDNHDILMEATAEVITANGTSTWAIVMRDK